MDLLFLFRLATEALLEEAKVGAKRAEVMGPSGWIKPKETVNKRFLHSTLRNTILANKHKSTKKKESVEINYTKKEHSKKS